MMRGVIRVDARRMLRGEQSPKSSADRLMVPHNTIVGQGILRRQARGTVAYFGAYFDSDSAHCQNKPLALLSGPWAGSALSSHVALSLA
jgi:hypothetical protein